MALCAASLLLAINSGRLVGSRKPWVLLLVFACSAAASPLLLLVQRWHHRSKPEYVLEVLDHIRSRDEAERDADYFTPQGMAIGLWAIDLASNAPMTNAKGEYSAPVVHGNVCDVGLQSKDGSGTIRLLKTDHWRFHDLYFNRSQGKEIGMWASYAKNHPYAAAWTLLWR